MYSPTFAVRFNQAGIHPHIYYLATAGWDVCGLFFMKLSPEVISWDINGPQQGLGFRAQGILFGVSMVSIPLRFTPGT